jgi:hypothetical protein
MLYDLPHSYIEASGALRFLSRMFVDTNEWNELSLYLNWEAQEIQVNQG